MSKITVNVRAAVAAKKKQKAKGRIAGPRFVKDESEAGGDERERIRGPRAIRNAEGRIAGPRFFRGDDDE